MNVLNKAEAYIREQGLLCPGDRVVVAVSGGPDSVALLGVLQMLAARWPLTLVAAHVNHGFRPQESAEEAALVAALAERLGLPLEVGVFDLPRYISDTGLNAQDAARRKRYGFLQETAARHGASKIALAHHAGDQAETLVMRFMRGTGPAGLVGMLPKRAFGDMELIRPFLGLEKEELLVFCRENGLPYCSDSSNEKRIYTRNRIRLDLLPALRAYNPRLTESLGRLSELLQTENAYLLQETQTLFQAIVQPVEGGYAFSRAAFLGAHLALQRRLIKLILDYLSAGKDDDGEAGYDRIQTILAFIGKESPPNIRWEAGMGVRFLREYDGIRLYAPPPDSARFFHYIGGQDSRGTLQFAGAGMEIEWWTTDRMAGPPSEAELAGSTVVFDREALRYPLTLRPRKQGDRMKPFGLNGSKKVKDIFIDAKIPAEQRRTWPVLTDAEDVILWLPGLTRSSHSMVTGNTGQFLCMTFRGLQGDRTGSTAAPLIKG